MTGTDYSIERTAEGGRVVVDGTVRATFVGDLDDPVQQAAFEEMVAELFPEAQPWPERPGAERRHERGATRSIPEVPPN